MKRPDPSSPHWPSILIIVGLGVHATWLSLASLQVQTTLESPPFIEVGEALAATILSGLLVIVGLLWLARRSKNLTWLFLAVIVFCLYLAFYRALFASGTSDPY